MSSLEGIRKKTRNEVEGALAGLRSKRADLMAKLAEVEVEIGLAEAWLGRSGSAPGRSNLTLQDAMKAVIEDDGNRGMRPARIAELVSERGLYRKKNGEQVSANQIQARASNYGHMFERVDGLIRLRDHPDVGPNR